MTLRLVLLGSQINEINLKHMTTIVFSLYLPVQEAHIHRLISLLAVGL